MTEPLVVVGLRTREVASTLRTEATLILGDEVLIGQTVLEKLDLFVDSRGRRLVPNPAHPDQSITKVKLAASEVA